MSIASRITSMENNIRNAYHGLESIGLDTSNVDKNIENISAVLDDFYDTLPKVSGSGSNIQLTPTKKGRITSQINGDTLQNGTPTPDSSVPIQSVTGLQKVGVCGKNLFNKNNATGSSLNADGTTSNSNTLTTSDFIRIDSSKTYYKTASGSSRVKLYDKNKNVISTSSIADISNFSNEQSFTIPYSNAEYIRITMTNENVDTFMLHIGSTATTYEAYSGETYTIHLGNMKLKKKGDYKDYISGTPNNWVKNNKIGNIIFNGTETWSNASSIASGTSRFLYLDDTVYNSRNNNDNTVYVVSNKFIGLSWKEIYSDDTTTKNAVANYNNNASTGGRIVIRIDSTYASTVDAFKTWLSNNNIEVDYVLATPTTTPITDTTLINDLNNFYYAMSKNGETNISVDGNLPMILDVSALKYTE